MDTPDPQFRVFCPKVKRRHLSEFKTKHIPSNVTTGFVGEIFRFVVPNDLQKDESFPIQVSSICTLHFWECLRILSEWNIAQALAGEKTNGLQSPSVCKTTVII